MNWKELLIGSIVTLFITIIAGLFIFYYTQEKSQEKKEILHYQSDKITTFSGNSKSFSISRVKIGSIGTLPSTNVKLIIEIKKSEIEEFSIQNESGIEISSILEQNNKKLIIKFKKIIPDEIAAITFITLKEEVPKITLRSDNSIGKKGIIYNNKKESNFILSKKIKTMMVSILSMFLIVLTYILFRNEIYKNRSSINDLGFILLHKGLINESEKILYYSMKKGDDICYSTSNYALAIGLSGDLDNARKYISAAKYHAKTKHQKAVVFFNKSLLLFFEGENKLAEESLKVALELSNKAIKSYCENSIHMEKIIKENSEIGKLLEVA